MGEPWPRLASLGWQLGNTAAWALKTPTPTAQAAQAPVDADADLAPGDAVPQTLTLYADVLAAGSLRAAAHCVVASLAGEEGIDRASIGLRVGRHLALLASSNLELGNTLAELPQRLLGAMDEAIEQGLALTWPPPAEAGTAAACNDAICLEHESLQRHLGGAVATVPLGHRGEVFAAVTVERHAGASFAPAEIEQLTRRLLLAAPALRWMQTAELPLPRRLLRDLLRGWHALRQPGRRGTRWALTAAASAVAFCGLAPLEHEVGGRARVEGAEQRVLSAPTDGFVKAAHVRPGDRVKAGAPLLDLFEEDLRLDRERWRSQLAQHENSYAAAMAKADRVGASTSMARVHEAQAQLALIDEQLGRGRIRAPFDALVIQGDLSQSIGAPVRHGDALLTLATTDRYRVIVEVDEVDIARVQPGQGGQLALSSLPWDRHALVVERVVPLAKAVDGRNVFEVQARLETAPPDIRPGLLGRAGLVVGRRPPLWVWTQRALDRLRLLYWSWIG